MLANAEMKVATVIAVGSEVPSAFECQARSGRGREVSCAPDQPGNIPGKRVEHLRRRVASRHALRVGRECGEILVPGHGQFAAQHPQHVVGQFWVLFLVVLDLCLPRRARLAPTPADALSEMLADAVGYQKLRVLRPTVAAFGQPDFVLAKWLAVRRAGVLLVGGAVPDVAVDNDERWPARGRLENPEGP